MTKALFLAAASLLLLAGCTSTGQAEATKVEAEEPAIDPGPIELSVEEAGQRYLGIVCQGNVAQDALYNAIVAGEDEYIQGGAPSVDAVKVAAAEKMRVTRQSIEMFDDEYFKWPEAVRDQIPILRSQDMLYLGAYGSLANASTYQEAYTTSFPELSSEQEAAAQEIRYQLKLDADTTASCVGFETKNDELYQEMIERNTLLEEQAAKEAEEAD